MRRKVYVLLAVLMGCVFILGAGCGGSGRIETLTYSHEFTLGDNDALLSNPGMGWNFCYYSNRLSGYGTSLLPGDTLDDFPCDIVFFRLGWKYFQPEKGRYDWSLVDSVIEEWVAKGKRVAFCWEICSPNTMDGQSCPLWLRDECGAEGVEYNLYEECQKYGFSADKAWDRPTWVPYYDDEVFLEYFSAFLEEAAKRYDGKDWVEFIEIGSIGTWGEGHSHMSWPAKIYPEVIPTHLRMWREAFPNTTVLVNDDLVNGRPAAIELSKELEFGCVDDGVQVPEAGMVNGRYANVDVFDEFWEGAACAIEHHPGTKATDVYYDSLWMSHASYTRLHMDPYAMKRADDGKWVDKMTRRLGYRLTVGGVWLTELKTGEKCGIKLDIKNTGVAPCYEGGFPAVIIKDSAGNEVLKSVSAFNVKALEVFETPESADYVSVEIGFTLPDALDAGKYTVNIAVVDGAGNPRYNLPLENGTDKIYRIATLQV